MKSQKKPYSRHASMHDRKAAYVRRRNKTMIVVVACLLCLVGAIWLFGRGRAAPIEHKPQSNAASPGASSRQATAAQTQAWSLVLVNKENPLPADYAVQTTALKSGKLVDSRMYDALKEMLTAGGEQNLSFVVCSAYRSVAYQQTLFDQKASGYEQGGMSHEDAIAKTATEIAVPGTSEHNLGLAVDIVALSYQVLDEKQAETAEQQWLMAHCAEYGFILRYPVDKSDITGIIYEPWHYRYVGVDAATEIMARGITLEEYLNA